MPDSNEENWEEDFLPQPAPPEPAPRPTTKAQAAEEELNLDEVSGLVRPKDTKGSQEVIKPWMKFHEFHLIQTGDELEQIVDRALAHGSCGLDLETEGFDNRIDYDAEGTPRTVHQIVGVCLAVNGVGYYVPVRHSYNATYDEKDPNVPPHQVERALSRLCRAAQPELTPEGLAEDPLASKKWVTGPQVVISFWNAKFDQEFLFPVTGIDCWHPDSFEDGQLLRYCIYTDDWSLKLKDKAFEHLKVKDPETGVEHPYEMIKFNDLFAKEVKKPDRKFQSLHPLLDKNVSRYGCSDAICTELLVKKFFPEAEALKVLYTYQIEKHTVGVVRMMERTRTKIDRQAVAQVLEEAEKELEILKKQLLDLAASKGFEDFNPASTKQLSEFLFTSRGLDINPKPPQTDGGQFKTDADTLEHLLEENPDLPAVLRWILHYRQIQRIIGTYLNQFLSDCDAQDQLRFNFNQTGAATGRFTAPAGDPDHGFFGGPIQGIPARNDPKKPKVAHSLRRVFVARDGYTLVKADYAGQELRLVANVSGEPLWINEFENGTGDLHTLTARAFYSVPEGTAVTKEQRTSGKCVHPGTLIYTDGKLQPIGELKFAENLDEFLGQSSTTFDGQAWKSLTASYNGGRKSLLHVVTSGGILTCTPNHKLKRRDGTFVNAGDLQEGDVLLKVDLPRVEDAPYPMLSLSLWDGIPASTFHLSHDLAYFAGVYAGDGTGSASSVCITHGSAEKLDAYGNPYEEWIQNLEASCAVCGFTTTRKDFGSLYLGSRVFVKYLQALGMHRKREKNLRVPPWVLVAGRTAILHYIGGILDTDGTVGEGHSMDWTTKDFVFAGQMAAAMRACGLDFNVELTFNKTYQRYYVRQRLTVKSSWDMRYYMRHPGKLGRLREPRHHVGVKDRFLVSKILPAGEEHCVDISVEESHVYVANGMVTHNTANFALVYGGGVQAVRRATGVDKHEAARQKAAFDKSVPTFTRWLQRQHELVKKNLGIRTALNRWIAIPDANLRAGGQMEIGPGKFKVADVPLAKKVQASCERKSVNYPIQGCGADVMKISMCRLAREFTKRKWLKTNGDDSVRMLMTVHDEIVFEVRHDRLEEAIPTICHVMESPTTKLKWKIPLIVEPLIGKNWEAKYDWPKIKAGTDPVPDWLVDYVKPGQAVQVVIPEPKPTEGSPKLPADPPTTKMTASRPSPPPKPVLNGTEQVAVFSISGIFLTEHTVRLVKVACELTQDPQGKLLRLTDDAGNILIDSAIGIKVNPDIFGYELRNRNLGHGRFEIITTL